MVDVLACSPCDCGGEESDLYCPRAFWFFWAAKEHYVSGAAKEHCWLPGRVQRPAPTGFLSGNNSNNMTGPVGRGLQPAGRGLQPLLAYATKLLTLASRVIDVFYENILKLRYFLAKNTGATPALFKLSCRGGFQTRPVSW
jgi:hypothetical protein